MEIGSLGSSGVQGVDSFGSLQTAKKEEEKSAGDRVNISDEAKYLYAEMQQNGAEAEEIAAQDAENGLLDNAEAAAKQSDVVGQSEDASAQAKSGDGKGGGQGGGKGGGGGQGGGATSGGSSSTESTTSETTLQAEIDAIEMQIAAAQAEAGEGKSNAQIEALEAELAALEDEYDELTEA